MNKSLKEKWDILQDMLKGHFGKEPDLEALLFLIGIQELNTSQSSFSKEEKEDLMHIATCTLLSEEGYYAFNYRDNDGWPHFERLKKTPAMDIEQQELFLMKQIIRYFEKTGFLNIDSTSNQ